MDSFFGSLFNFYPSQNCFLLRNLLYSVKPVFQHRLKDTRDGGILPSWLCFTWQKNSYASATVSPPGSLCWDCNSSMGAVRCCYLSNQSVFWWLFLIEVAKLLMVDVPLPPACSLYFTCLEYYFSEGAV